MQVVMTVGSNKVRVVLDAQDHAAFIEQLKYLGDHGLQVMIESAVFATEPRIEVGNIGRYFVEIEIEKGKPFYRHLLIKGRSVSHKRQMEVKVRVFGTKIYSIQDLISYLTIDIGHWDVKDIPEPGVGEYPHRTIAAGDLVDELEPTG